jgi:hypothetical protein
MGFRSGLSCEESDLHETPFDPDGCRLLVRRAAQFRANPSAAHAARRLSSSANGYAACNDAAGDSHAAGDNARAKWPSDDPNAEPDPKYAADEFDGAAGWR